MRKVVVYDTVGLFVCTFMFFIFNLWPGLYEWIVERVGFLFWLMCEGIATGACIGVWWLFWVRQSHKNGVIFNGKNFWYIKRVYKYKDLKLSDGLLIYRYMAVGGRVVIRVYKKGDLVCL